jgi:hypothetical protein
MAIERDPNMPSSGSTIPPLGSTIPPLGSTMDDRDALNTTGVTSTYDRDTVSDRGGSNFWAFLVGGLVIAIGLLAFLFYDGGSTTSRDVSTTGSTTPRVESPARPTTPPATPSTPASPSAPATPAR